MDPNARKSDHALSHSSTLDTVLQIGPVALLVSPIRGVALGVVGVAAIQSLLIGVGFFAIGLPAAGLWTLAALLLGIVQALLLLLLPIIVYVFATEATTPAIVFMAWTFVAGLSDNVLKPLMLGRGLEAPMPVILPGVLGGMLADGLLGLFVGPVLLAVGYVLLMEWLLIDTQPVSRLSPTKRDVAPGHEADILTKLECAMSVWTVGGRSRPGLRYCLCDLHPSFGLGMTLCPGAAPRLS